MRSVYSDQMDIIWAEFKAKIDQIGLIDFLTKTEPTLQKKMAVSYKDLFLKVKQQAQNAGKNRNEVKYCLLKLKRLIALWSKKSVVCGDFRVTYSTSDIHLAFPLFSSQNFDIMPTAKTIKTLKGKLIADLVKNYNARLEKLDMERFSSIKNLNDLRCFLMSKYHIEAGTANGLANLYKEYSAKAEVNEFSKTLK